MELLLTVASYEGRPPLHPASLRIDSGSCTLGRNPGNDLALSDPDRLVSGVHAEIDVRPDGVWLTDRSTNGTFVNHAPQRIAPHSPTQLHDGDILSVGPYEIAVSLRGTQSAPDPLLDPFAAAPAPPPEADLPGLVGSGPAPDIMALLGGTPGQPPSVDLKPARDPFADAQALNSVLTGPAREAEPAGAPAHPTPVENVFFRPPETQPIPEDYDLLGDLGAAPPSGQEPPPPPPPVDPFAFDFDPFGQPPGPEPSPAPVPPTPGEIPEAVPPQREPAVVAETLGDAGPPPAPPPLPLPEAPIAPGPPPPTAPPILAGPQPERPAEPGEMADTGIAAFLAGLGTGNPAEVKDPDALLRQAGSLLRALTAGLVSTMMVRARFKSELRLGMTVIRPKENNPFKFSVSPDEALERLLLRPNPGFLPPLESAREAFEDIQAHEMAMVAGLRAALRALLARFEPSALEARLEAASGLDKLLPMARRSRYWEQFTEIYGQVAADAEDDFMQLFGETFTRAYEDQIHRLAEARKRAASGSAP